MEQVQTTFGVISLGRLQPEIGMNQAELFVPLFSLIIAIVVLIPLSVDTTTNRGVPTLSDGIIIS
jgi:hypothetical protein